MAMRAPLGRLLRASALAALLAGCGGSGHGQRAAISSSTGSPAHATNQHGPSPRVETVTRNGAVLVISPGVAYSVESQDQTTASSFTPGDSVAVNEEEEITDLRSGRRVSASEIGDIAEANRYPHGGTRHMLATGSPDGSIVVLNDESVWAVSPAGRATAASWVHGAPIAVPPRSHLLYRLVNSDDRSTIRASYIGEEES
jgi:hypothetical protein